DVGCYGVSTARLFAGAEPEAVYAAAHFAPSGVDLSLGAVLRFSDDVLGVIDCSFEQPFRCCYELVGTEGVLEVPDAYLPPARPLARLVKDGRTEEFSFDGADQYGAMVDAFAEAVGGGRLTPPAEDGLAQMEALDAILAAAKRA